MPKKIKYITPEKLSSMRMVSGGEKEIDCVVDLVPMVKRWVGIGWVTEREADIDDLRKYPVVKRVHNKHSNL